MINIWHKNMRTLYMALFVILFVFGCASPTRMSHSKWEGETATQLGISRKEVAEIGRRAVAEGKLVVVMMIKKEGGVIEVYLAESVDSHHGTFVRFNKVNDNWVKIDDHDYIAKWQE